MTPTEELCSNTTTNSSSAELTELKTRALKFEKALRDIQAIPYPDYATNDAGRLIADIVSDALKPAK